MKKLILIAIILFPITLSKSFAQNDKKIGDKGFYLNIGLFKPNYDFFTPKSIDFEKSDFKRDELFKMGLNFEIGNYFKLKNFNEHSLQLKISWLEANYSYANLNTKAEIMQGSVLKFGPNFTYVLSDDMGVDAFYQISPTYTYFTSKSLPEYSTIGAVHCIGIGFRYKKLTTGFNFNFGHGKDSVYFLDNPEDLGLEKDDINYRTGSFRFYIGFKF